MVIFCAPKDLMNSNYCENFHLHILFSIDHYYYLIWDFLLEAFNYKLNSLSHKHQFLILGLMDYSNLYFMFIYVCLQSQHRLYCYLRIDCFKVHHQYFLHYFRKYQIYLWHPLLYLPLYLWNLYPYRSKLPKFATFTWDLHFQAIFKRDLFYSLRKFVMIIKVCSRGEQCP